MRRALDHLAPHDERVAGRTFARETGGEAAPGQPDEHYDRDDHHNGAKLPEKLHRDRSPGRRASSRRPTPAIHLQRKATWTGTSPTVTSAVRACSRNQN